MTAYSTRKVEEDIRLTTSEVCRLARISEATLRRRVKARTFPQPVDRGRENLYDYDDVMRALGKKNDETKENPWANAHF